MHSSEKGSTFEKSSRVFFLKSKKLSSSLSKFGKGKMYSPDFSFILKPVLANKLHFMINSFLFERSSGSVKCGGIYDKIIAYSSCSFYP